MIARELMGLDRGGLVGLALVGLAALLAVACRRRRGPAAEPPPPAREPVPRRGVSDERHRAEMEHLALLIRRTRLECRLMKLRIRDELDGKGF